MAIISEPAVLSVYNLYKYERDYAVTPFKFRRHSSMRYPHWGWAVGEIKGPNSSCRAPDILCLRATRRVPRLFYARKISTRLPPG